MRIISTLLNKEAPDYAPADKRKTITAVVAVLVIVGSVTSLVVTMLNRGPKPNFTHVIGIGEAMADQTAKVLNNHGRVVVLQEEDEGQVKVVLRAQSKAFQDRLKTKGGIEIAAVELVKLDERTSTVTPTHEQFESVLKKYSTVDALVTFVGLPQDIAPNQLALPSPAPKIVAYLSTPFSGKQFLVAGVVTVAICPRVNVNESPTPPKTPTQWFEQYFQVFDASNYDSMPD